MKYIFIVIVSLSITTLFGGCSNKTEWQLDRSTRTFPTKTEAVDYFLQENNSSDVELIKTINDEEVLIRRTDNEHYTLYGIGKREDRHWIEKLTVDFDIHNTSGISFKFSTRIGNEYTIVIERQYDELPPAMKSGHTLFPVLG